MPSITESERTKYQAAWAMDAYAENSPGEHFVDVFMEMAGAQAGQTVLDIGCGGGAGTRALQNRGLVVRGFDLVGGDMQGSIWERAALGDMWFNFGYCTDVMEHIPPQFVGLSIANMLDHCGRVFLSVSFKQDIHGDALRDRLHLTVEPFSWWLATFRELGTVYEARDLIGDGLFLVAA